MNQELDKPSEESLYEFKEIIGELKNYSEGHPLNTKKALSEVQSNDQVYCFCFSEHFIYAGYGDGLICCFQKEEKEVERDPNSQPIPLIGHTNKINAMEALKGSDRLFSASNDCTIREW